MSTCEHCVFVQAENSVQFGCELNRCDLLGSRPPESNFYKLDRYCSTFRPQHWVNRVGKENLVVKVKNEVKFRPSIIVIVREHQTLEDIKGGIEKLKELVDGNFQIYWIIRNKSLSVLDIMSVVKGFGTWKIEYSMNDDDNTGKYIVRLSKKFNTNYYIVFECNEPIPDSLFEKIDFALNEKLLRFSAIRPISDEYHCFVNQSSLSRFLVQLEDYETVLSRLEALAEKYECQTFIMNHNSL